MYLRARTVPVAAATGPQPLAATVISAPVASDAATIVSEGSPPELSAPLTDQVPMAEPRWGTLGEVLSTEEVNMEQLEQMGRV